MRKYLCWTGANQILPFILPNLAIGSSIGLEEALREIDFLLNVADDVDLYPAPRNYHKIPIKDSVPHQLEKLGQLAW